jgi:hypothetical protein
MVFLTKWATPLALCVLALVLGCFPVMDHDTWWHLAAGRLVLQSGWPTVDVWTYTADKPWIDLYWLPQIIFYGLYQLGGTTALVLLKMAAAVGIAALVLAGVPKRAPSWVTVVVMIPALVLITGRLRERPEMFSLLYLAAFLAIVARAKDSQRRLLWLPALQVMWVNSHGLFVLGPMILGAHLVAVLAERGGREATRWAGAALTLSLVSCLVNPYGVGVFAHVVQQSHQLDDGFYRRHIVELQTLSELAARAGWFNPYVLATLLLAALGVAGFVSRRGRPRVFPALLFAATAYLAFRSVRLIPVFAIVTASVALANLTDAFGPRRRSPWPAVAVAVFASWVISGALYRWSGDGRTVGMGEAPGAFAHDACDFLATHGPARVIAANLGQASVCTYHLRQDQRQFLVSRIEPASDDAFRAYVDGIGRLLHGRAGWKVSLGIDYARPAELPAILIDRGLELAASNLDRDPRWKLVYRDESAAVFFSGLNCPSQITR